MFTKSGNVVIFPLMKPKVTPVIQEAMPNKSGVISPNRELNMPGKEKALEHQS